LRGYRDSFSKTPSSIFMLTLCRSGQGRIPLGRCHLPAVTSHFLQGMKPRPLQTTCNSSPSTRSNFRTSCDINKIGAPVWKLTCSTGIYKCSICPIEQVDTLVA
jgi:hypothetical protein